MKKITFLLLLSSLIIKAQPGKEAWHWNFGGICAIDFSSGTAVSGVTPWFNSIINCASYSNPNTGQLVLYTNGVSIENATNHAVFNGVGLLGSEYVSQGALIVPKPNSNSIYYVITADIMFPYPAHLSPASATNKGIHYSVVDMSLKSGLGEVVLKNQLLTPPPTCEKVTAVKNCNGTDYWIITHPYLSNAFNAYLVTATGINLNPIVSHVGTFINDSVDSPQEYQWEGGCFKASPNGKKLVFAEADSLDFLELYDFDNSTGIVSNPIKMDFANVGHGIFGVSFSPDNSKLYATTQSYPKPEAIYQYDISSNNASTIIASQYIVADSIPYDINSVGEIGAMQLAPDGKIYIARYHVDTLAVINNPNNLGSNCNFNLSGLALQGSQSYMGLPNFIDANYAGININISDVRQCVLFSTDTLKAASGFASYQWNTGAATNSIVINSPGKYWVTVTNNQGCAKTDTVNAYLINPIKKDTSVCGIYNANAMQNAALNYNWYDGNTSPVRSFTNTGVYWVDISYLGGCEITDTFNIKINPLPKVNLGNDTTFCMGNLFLNAFNASSTYSWSTSETSSSIIANKPATYWVKVTNVFNCPAYDTLIVYPEIGLFNFVMPNIVTPNNDNINDEIDFSKYQFSDLQITIYNRWGLKVFESTNPQCIWKPTDNDREGIYFVNLQYKINCGDKSATKNSKEFITLAR